MKNKEHKIMHSIG